MSGKSWLGGDGDVPQSSGTHPIAEKLKPVTHRCNIESLAEADQSAYLIADVCPLIYDYYDSRVVLSFR
jgi:hypothetical protein